MTPQAEPASPAAAVPSAVPAGFIEDGEAIILAIRPSPWFILLTSWPVLALLGLVALGGYVAADLLTVNVPPRTVLLFCAAMAAVRLLYGICQWQARLYVLTSRRVMWIRGTFRAQVIQCPLKKLRQTHLSISPPEKLLGIGSLFFAVVEGSIAEPVWTHIARPAEVQEIVNEAIGRAR